MSTAKPNQSMIGDPKEIFEILGLNDREIRVIKATSKMARSMAYISREADIPSTSLLYVLNSLKKRRLIKTIGRGRKHTFWRSDMQKIYRRFYGEYLKDKSGKFDFGTNDPTITVYRGRNDIFEIFEKLASMPKNTRLFAIQPDNSIRPALRKNPVADWLRIDAAIRDRKYIVEGIVHEKSVETVVSEVGQANAKKIFESFIGRLEDYVKIPEEFANVGSEMYAFNGSAYIINWNKEIAIGIHDKETVGLLLAMFSCVKELGTRYSQNEKMRQKKEMLAKEVYSPKYASTTSLRARTGSGLPSESNSPESRT